MPSGYPGRYLPSERSDSDNGPFEARLQASESGRQKFHAEHLIKASVAIKLHECPARRQGLLESNRQAAYAIRASRT